MVAIVSSSRDTSVLENVGVDDPDVVTAAGLAFWLALLGAQLGWMLFVYLRMSALTRAIALIASLGVTVSIAVAMLMGALPAA
jgi:hypothetical protein